MAKQSIAAQCTAAAVQCTGEWVEEFYNFPRKLLPPQLEHIHSVFEFLIQALLKLLTKYIFAADCYIRMDFDTNEYPNIFVSRKWHEDIP